MSIETDRTTPLRTGARTQLGPYQLLTEIGHGGMADVYLARLAGAGPQRTLVIKAMRGSLLKDPELVEMFRVEGSVSAQLVHRNIVRVHGFNASAGVPYMVMEHIDGWTVDEVWKRQRALGRPMPVAVATFIAREVAHALAYAHEFTGADGKPRPVIHRDVSPSNVMLSRDGSVRLLDFGIAKVKGGLARATGHVLKGKYGYMAPEQVTFAECDHRIDLFALGIVLYELLTGERAFSGKDDRETLDRIVEAKLERPSRKNGKVKRKLDALVERALARLPADRFESARDLARALDDAGTGSHATLADHLGTLFTAPMHAAPVSAVPSHVACAASRTMEMSPPSQVSWPTAPPPADPPWVSAPPPAEPPWARPAAPPRRRSARRGRAFLDVLAFIALALAGPTLTLRPEVAQAAQRATAFVGQRVGGLFAVEGDESPDMGIAPLELTKTGSPR